MIAGSRHGFLAGRAREHPTSPYACADCEAVKISFILTICEWRHSLGPAPRL